MTKWLRFLRFFWKSKKMTFYVFLRCCTRFLEHWVWRGGHPSPADEGSWEWRKLPQQSLERSSGRKLGLELWSLKEHLWSSWLWQIWYFRHFAAHVSHIHIHNITKHKTSYICPSYTVKTYRIFFHSLNLPWLRLCTATDVKKTLKLKFKKNVKNVKTWE